MANKESVFKIKIVSEGGDVIEKDVNNIQDLSKSVSDLQGELSKAPIGGDRWKELNQALSQNEKALTTAKEEVKKLDDQMKGVKAPTGITKLTQDLEAIPGPVGQSIQGIKGLGTAFKVLLANPVGLFITGIVTALTALYKAFTSTKEGGELLAQGTAALGAVMDVLRDTLVLVAKGLIKVFQDPVKALKEFGNLLKENITNRVEGMLELLPALGKAISLALSGEFKQAAKVATDAVGKVTLGVENITDKAVAAGKAIGDTFKEAADEAKAAANITKELQRIDDAQRELNKRRAEQNKLIAEAKLKINDESLSIAERQAALEQVRQTEISLADQEAALAQRRYEAIRAQNALSDSSKEALDAEAAAYVTLQNALLASTQKQKELYDQQFALTQRGIAEAKAVADLERTLRTQGIEEENERIRQELAAAKEADYAAIDLLKTSTEKKNELKLLADEKYQAGLLKIETDANKKLMEARTKSIDDELKLEQLKLEGKEQLTKEDYEKTLELMKLQMENLLTNTELTNTERLLIEQQYKNGVEAINQALIKSDEDLQKAKIDQQIAYAQQASAALGDIATAFGENTVAGKTAAIAQATINTYLGATQAYNSLSVIPVVGPALGIAAAAAAIVSGLKQVREIQGVSSNVPKPKFQMGGIVEGSGGPQSDMVQAYLSPGEAIINSSATARYRNLLSDINQSTGGSSFNPDGVRSASGGLDTLNQMTTTPLVKTYVVASEIASETQLERVIKSRSTI